MGLNQRVLERELGKQPWHKNKWFNINWVYIEITCVISLLVVAAYILGDPIAARCLTISYQVDSLNQYGKGYNDCFFVAF